LFSFVGTPGETVGIGVIVTVAIASIGYLAFFRKK
jgi:hypothetical protein